jgi:adenosylcobinamide-phosphate synthase
MQSALIALMTGIILDLFVGDPPNHFHPVVMMGSFIRWMTKKWNKGNTASRFRAGAALIFFGSVLFSFPWLIIGTIGQGLPAWAQGILTGFLLKPMFAFRGLLKSGLEVQQALRAGDLNNARRLVAWHLVSRDTSELTERQVASATIESIAENLTDSFLSPLLCFAVGGLPLAWFYRFVNTADAMIGYHTPAFEYFGKFTARLDDLLNWLPARLAGLILVASAVLSRLNGKTAWNIMIHQHGRTSSPNAGWTMAAASGALEVILEKKGYYRLEGGCELPQAQDIQRAAGLLRVSFILSLFLCGGVIHGIQFLF